MSRSATRLLNALPYLPGFRPTRRACRLLPVPLAGQRAELHAVVRRGDLADGSGAGAHDERLGCRLGAVAVADSLEQVSVGHAGGREEDVLAGHQAIDVEHLIEVVPGVESGPALFVVAGPQAPDQLPAHRLDRRGRENAFGRSADSPQQV